MDDDNNLIFQVNLTDLDLNQEPTVQSLLSQLDSAHERVEARIRQIEAAEEIQRQQQNPTRINLFPGQTTDNANHDRSTLDGANNVGILHRKPGGSHLVAKPLELNSDVSNSDKDRGSFYDCNICLEMASDPVLTCCGHLFCWPCFYQVSNINSTSKECPVCKGEVSETTVTPIYGNGGEGERVVVTESGLRIPPRPRAHRVESIRQHIVTHGLNDLAIEQALRQIRPSLVSTVWPAIQGGVGGDNADNEPGLLPQTDDSLSYLSSFLSGADMLMQLDSAMNNRTSRDYVQDSGGLDLHVAHPYSLRGRRRRFTVPSGSGEGGRGARESRRRRRLN